MIQIPSLDYTIEIGEIHESSLQKILSTDFKQAKKVIICDENTHEHCVSHLTIGFDELANAEIIVLPAGEDNKIMEICMQVWEALSEYQIQRNDLIINVGGGMITDLGAFVASIYKRGVSFINIPTSLLAMVDASSGGKTGGDLGVYKNQLGLFSIPKLVVCDPIFLSTLTEEEKLWGKAEMLKHGLIQSKEHWDKLKKLPVSEISLEDIGVSIAIKNDLVLKDFKEEHIRKTLNFGHTIGHAIEGHFLSFEKKAHGHCVAWGLVAESLLAYKFGQLTKDDYQDILGHISNEYPPISIKSDAIASIIELMKNDKKNRLSSINFTSISSIGSAQIDQTYTVEQITEVVETLFTQN